MNEEEKQLHIRMPKEDYKKLKIKCIYEDTSMQDYVAKLICESLVEYSTEEQLVDESTHEKLNKGQ